MNRSVKGIHINISGKTAKICYAAFIFLTFLLVTYISSQQFSLDILEPDDKLITAREMLIVRGKAPDVKEVTVNGLKIGVKSDGMFSAGLILKPGKNLVEVKVNEDGNEVSKQIRLLRVIHFPDMEINYKGKKHWARRDITSMATLGIVEGYPDNTFKPKKAISRGEMATWISRAKDLIVKDIIEDVFFDVPKEHWRAPFVKAVIDVGYMQNISPNTFGIGSEIDRGAAANVIDKVEILDIPSRVTSSPFLDVPVEHEYASAIYAAFYGKMVIGVSKAKRIYQPDRQMNRAEATVLISRIKNVKNKLDLLYNFEKGYDNSKLCKVNTPPVVTDVSIAPSVISTATKVLMTFNAKVSDLQGLSDILQVKIDLTAVDGPPNAIMYDDGTHDDDKANDGVYTLRVGIGPGVEDGTKTIKVFATDEYGFTGIGQGKLNVKK